MNETVRNLLEKKLTDLGLALKYHQGEAKEYRALVRSENLDIKTLKQKIADIEEELNAAD